MDESDSTDDYEFSDVAPWQRTTEATLNERKSYTVECKGCGEEWSPRDPDSPPKNCKSCKARLAYDDDAAQLAEVPTQLSEVDDNPDTDQLEDDIDEWFNGDES